MEKDKIKTILFDVGGVLVLKGNIDWARIDKKYNLEAGKAKNIFMDCYHQKTTGEDFNLKAYFERNYSELLSWSEFKEIRRGVFQKEAPNQELLEWIENHKKSYTMGIVTNNTASLESLLEDKFEIRHLFDHIFNSAKIGYPKPDERFYKHVLKSIDSQPKQCLFVDNKKENIEAARSFGFQAVLFKNNKDFFNLDLEGK